MMILLFGAIIFVISGCNSDSSESLPCYEDKAASHVKSKGYRIHSSLGVTNTYTLDSQKLTQKPYMDIWSVQETEPDPYLGKTITTCGFVVSNHPLEEKYADIDQENDYEFHVHIMLAEGRVIGGTTVPVRKNGATLFGGVYSLDGKTLEEITGLDYKRWLEEWEKKYGKYQTDGN